MRCRICGEQITGRTWMFWKHEHYRKIHPEYSEWFGLWLRNFYLLLAFFILALSLADFLWLNYGGTYSYIGGIVNLLFIGFIVYDLSWIRWRTVRRFIRQWKAQGSLNSGS